MNKALMLPALMLLAGCQHDTASVRDPVRQPPTTAPTATIDAHSNRLSSLGRSTQGNSSDTTRWQELKNKWGWKVRVPESWEAYCIGQCTNETAEEVVIEGPKGCYQAGERCGRVDIIAMPLQSEDLARLSPKEFLLKHLPDDGKLISEGETRVGGLPAYEIVSLKQKGTILPVRVIALRRESKNMMISYHEDAKDRPEIKSPDDWKLVPIFEKMLSTFSFIPPTCRELPCR